MAEIPAFGQMILFVQEGLLGMFEAFLQTPFPAGLLVSKQPDLWFGQRGLLPG